MCSEQIQRERFCLEITEVPMHTQDKYSQRFAGPSAALRYARRFETGSRRRIDRREQQAAATVFGKLSPCASVLDVPCGAGRFLDLLAQNKRMVIAMDVSASMVELARERAAHLTPQPAVRVGEAARTELQSEAVDCVFCNRLLHHLDREEERAAILREFWRVTRHYLVVSFFDYHSFWVLRRFFKALKGRKKSYREQPTLQAFANEVGLCGFRLLDVVRVGPPWISQKYLVLAKAADLRMNPNQTAMTNTDPAGPG